MTTVESEEATRGGWIQTYTGRVFFPLDPRVADIEPIDIIWALSHANRFLGHTKRPYSVAEHCCRVHDLVTAKAPRQLHTRLAALLHDGEEAYLCDLPTPIKRSVVGYAEAETRVSAVIFEAFDIRPGLVDWSAIRYADLTLLATEKRYLMAPTPRSWIALPQPLDLPWWDRMGWSPQRARWAFKRRLRALIYRMYE